MKHRYTIPLDTFEPHISIDVKVGLAGFSSKLAMEASIYVEINLDALEPHVNGSFTTDFPNLFVNGEKSPKNGWSIVV